jgi:hypothetical protein
MEPAAALIADCWAPMPEGVELELSLGPAPS